MTKQTLDNNVSEENKKENQLLTQELAIRAMNLLKWNEETTTLLIQHHIQDWEYRNNNVLMPKEQTKKEAIETFYRYKESGFIDEWNNIREDLKQYIA